MIAPEKCQSRVGRVLDDVWTTVRVIGMCIGRCMDNSQGNRYVYWTMCGQQSGQSVCVLDDVWTTVRVIGLNSHQLRGQTVHVCCT